MQMKSKCAQRIRSGKHCPPDPVITMKGGAEGLADTSFRLLFESSADAILLIDGKCFVDCNKAAADMIRCRKEDLLSLQPHELSPEMQPDGSLSSEKAQRLIAGALEKGNVRFEWIHRRFDGEEFPVEVLLTAIPFEGRQVLYTVWRDITERKRVEKAVNSGYQMTHSILEHAPMGVVVVNEEGFIDYANAAMARISGNVPQEIMSMNVFRLPTYRAAGLDEKIKAAIQGEPFSMGPLEYTSYFSGRTTMRTFTGMPMEEDGRKKALVFVEDITQQKKAEEQLEKERETFLAIFRQAPYGVALVAQDGRFVYINPEFTSITGYTLNDVPTGRDWFRRAYPDGELRRKVIESWKEDVLRGRNCRFFSVTRKDRAVREVEFRYTRLEDGRSIIMLSDITERKQSDELFRTLASNSPIGIYIVQGGKFCFVNPYFLQCTGYAEEEVMGREALFPVVPDDRADARESAVRMLKGGGSSGYEYRVVNKRGETRWILETVAPITYKGKRAVLANFIDITDRKQAEGKMRYISLHDNLTGLYNRAFFEEEMARLASVRFNPVGIVIGDVDGLKLINDILGHGAGDALLVAAANVIRTCFRESDVVARVGGDEFAVLLPNTPAAVVERICRRIQDTIAAFNRENPHMALSISVGFATKNESSTKMSELFREADNNMYSQKLCQTQAARSAIVSMLMRALEARGVITKGRVEYIRGLVTALGSKMGLSDEDIASLRLLAKFRDIGEVGIPNALFKKKGILTPEELAEIRRHCEIGYRVAMSTPELNCIAEWILRHHEWWNGNGYPLGLKGDEIPLQCRILSIAGAYDAMVNDRPYRRAMSHVKAVEELNRQSGTQFDPTLVDVFLNLLSGLKDETASGTRPEVAPTGNWPEIALYYEQAPGKAGHGQVGGHGTENRAIPVRDDQVSR
jgi:diguanylate cyclase (GGDEF)-like protein/PAS domain S-box-containing protein